ncbi:hypothetical protein B0920_10650 [Massilia sp. KIM]|nr:hypothetical protein B0920_10650 [Massilia sp. KIM]
MRAAGLWLRLRLALGRINPPVAAVLALLAAGAFALAWLLAAREELERDYAAARQAARAPAPVRAAPPPAPPSSDQNLAEFYAALGARRDVEHQLKSLFALAGKHGLALQQGEYRSSYDRAARLHTYQINLPVKGAYGAIWQFVFAALRALPHASLDDLSFRRDSIGDPQVEARLRLTLYLLETPGVPQ